MENKIMIMNILTNIREIINMLLDISVNVKEHDIYLESLNKYIKLYHKVLNELDLNN